MTVTCTSSLAPNLTANPETNQVEKLSRAKVQVEILSTPQQC